MDERKVPWSGEYPQYQVRQRNLEVQPRNWGPSRAQDRQLRDRVSLFVMGNQCSGPNGAYLRKLSPKHRRLAALNRPASSLRPLSLPYPRNTPTPSYAC
ncbi:NADH dehydrogenase subunit 2 [Iris pallida]|uniref:NADH dehydrogenase subunit 2 (Mitochondrion) n=1 Tax=Iris pallida TaxID=29817 RepID=A0AAX6G8J6_IRIPA|nr:NADH dehydrogenase subunit 2 [Iris pallida]KAJ6830151.1 NADH dehydrogenase subunit 2 [Iris pallida]